MLQAASGVVGRAFLAAFVVCFLKSYVPFAREAWVPKTRQEVKSSYVWNHAARVSNSGNNLFQDPHQKAQALGRPRVAIPRVAICFAGRWGSSVNRPEVRDRMLQNLVRPLRADV